MTVKVTGKVPLLAYPILMYVGEARYSGPVST